MFVDLHTYAIDALIDVARDEIKEIEGGRSFYGDRDSTVDMLGVLHDAVTALEKARDEDRQV